MTRGILMAGLVLLASFLLPGCAGNHSQPLIYYHGAPWAKARVNGEEGMFLLDTGAGISVIDEELARRANLRPGESQEIVGTAGSVKAETAWAGNIELGGKTHRERLLAVQDFQRFRAPGGRRQAGIIGCDFFLEYTLQLDLEDSEFLLTREQAPLSPGLKSFPMHLVGGTPMIEVTFPPREEPYLARFDTGSGYADEAVVYLGMGYEVAQEVLGPRLEEAPDGEVQVRSLSGEERLNIYRHGPVSMLGKEFEEVLLVVRRDGARGAFADGRTILVTGGLLNQFGHIELDFPRRRIWVAGE